MFTESSIRACGCALALSLCAGPVAAANLLVNPGFEDGLNGWEISSTATIRTADPDAFEGTNYVYGQNTAFFGVTQVVDLLLGGVPAGEIDRGALNLVFGGYQAGYRTQRDFGQITVRLLDGGGTQLTAVSTPAFFSSSTWVEQRGEIFLLPGTRSVSFEFAGTRRDGSNDDAYLDAAFLDVAPAPVPLPAALPSMVGALGALALRRRRRRA